MLISVTKKFRMRKYSLYCVKDVYKYIKCMYKLYQISIVQNENIQNINRDNNLWVKVPSHTQCYATTFQQQTCFYPSGKKSMPLVKKHNGNMLFKIQVSRLSQQLWNILLKTNVLTGGGAVVTSAGGAASLPLWRCLI